MQHTAALEEEPVHKFQDVVMRQEQFMRFPVVLDVARTHIRLTSVRFIIDISQELPVDYMDVDQSPTTIFGGLLPSH